MARPVMRSLERFPTKTKLLYDTRIKALRRAFKADGNANNAFFVFDYLFREIFGNEGYYVRHTDDLVGDTADFCYLDESFVQDVIRKCIDLDLFDKRQFEQNRILTSRAIQNKYRDIFIAMKRVAEIDSRFCVLDGGVYSEETPVYSEETSVYSEETPHKEMEENKRKQGKKKIDVSILSENDSDWDRLLEKWQTLEGSPVKVEIPTWLVVPQKVSHDFFCRTTEYGAGGVLATVDLLRVSPYWQNRKIGIGKFLEETTFLKLHDGGYDWSPGAPKNRNDRPDKSEGCAAVHPDDEKKFEAWNTTNVKF